MSDTLLLILFGPTAFIFAVSLGISILFTIKYIVDWMDKWLSK